MKKLWGAVVIASALVVAAAACGGDDKTQGVGGVSSPGTPGGPNPYPDGSGTPVVDAGTVDAGVDAGTPTPDAGAPDAGPVDAGPVDAGVVDAGPGPGPWPVAEITNFSNAYNIPSVQSVGIDDAYNIWLLKNDKIGVLRPGTKEPVWVSGIGQAAHGFGKDALAEGSTVICGGAAGQAYVGYWTYDLTQPERTDPADPEFRKGDLDIVQLNGDGTISLTEHMWRSAGTSQPDPQQNIGIRNTNDWHFDEDRSVFACTKVMRGTYKGELYVSGNHGVTRIRGLEYDAHRHPVWEIAPGNLRIGYSYALGISQSGDVLIGNEWKVGIATPPPALADWELFGPTPWKLDTYDEKLNSLEEMDYWRGFQQTTDGHYYLASMQYGLWQMDTTQWAGSANWAEVKGLPTNALNALAATDNGSLYIGTDDSGLWVMDASKKLSKVDGVPGSKVIQLVYDPTTNPSMLLVLTNSGLTVIRGK